MENKDTKRPPIYLTTKDDPRIAAKMREVSKRIFEKNKEAYKKLATR
ncbi:MAG: hypothetical protein WCS30_05165 [Selenomonadaceae bacterium]